MKTKKQPPASESRREKLRHNAEMKWKYGEWDTLSGYGKRKRVLFEQNNKCAICGIPPMWNNKPLCFQLDHISGNKYDNSRDNLRLICPNCHTQTPTWGSRNASASGRNKMREALQRVKKDLFTSRPMVRPDALNIDNVRSNRTCDPN